MRQNNQYIDKINKFAFPTREFYNEHMRPQTDGGETDDNETDDESIQAFYQYALFNPKNLDNYKEIMKIETIEFLMSKHTYKLALILEQMGFKNIDKFMKRDRLYPMRCRVLEPMARIMSETDCSANTAFKFTIKVAKSAYKIEQEGHALTSKVRNLIHMNKQTINFKHENK